MFTKSDGTARPGRIVAAIAIGWLCIWGIWIVLDWVGSRATPQAGQIGVVRSGPSAAWIGAWFNGRGIRNVVPPGSGSTYIGLGSTVHWYPDDSVQRNYTISANPSQGDLPGVDVVQVPTSDGIEVGLQGTFYFTTGFNASPEGQKLLRDFDNRFGIRTFALDPTSSDTFYPWDGTNGWEAFLNVVVRPIIDNDLRRAIASVSCPQLVSSCALVHEQTAAALNGNNNSAAIQAVQAQINSTLQTDIASTLGSDYFSNVKFLLAKVALPSAIQVQIENAQAQFAAVGQARAKVQQATLLAQADKEKERGYRSCPACAEAAVLSSIPSSVTTFAPGAGFAVTAK